jgi:hypothetical protein
MRQHEQRRHARLRVDCAAMLLFKDEVGRAARYNSAGLKDVAAGGVLLEYGKNAHIDSHIAQGKQFELIFQLYDNEPPVRMQCEICRVSKDKEQTSLGVFFVGPDKKLNAEVIRTLAGRAGSKPEVQSKA